MMIEMEAYKSAFWISFLHLRSKKRYCSLGGLIQMKSIFHNVPLEGVRVSRCSGIAIPANAAAELVTLVAEACWWGFVFALFDPNVSHWTTKTPNTTAISSVWWSEITRRILTVDHAERIADKCDLTGSINEVNNQIDRPGHKRQRRADDVPREHLLHTKRKLVVCPRISAQHSSQ